jgi:sirohydrochlorin cobaltochelatase
MDSNSKSQNNIGVLLISHGSSLPHSFNIFTEICDKFREVTDFNVEVGYMKVSKPSIPEAINNIKLKGEINEIIAVPIFLANGIHTNIDIPLMLGLNPKEIDPRCPDGNYPENHYLNLVEDVDFHGKITLLDPIGPDPLILKIIKNRLDSLLENSSSKVEKTGVVLISHGSRLNYNHEFISELLEMFNKENSYKATMAFMELCQPSIPVAINDFVKKNDFEHLIAVPVFIAPGVHTNQDIPRILEIYSGDFNSKLSNHSHTHSNKSHSHSHTHFHGDENEKISFDGKISYLEPLGADPLIIEIIKEKVENAIK